MSAKSLTLRTARDLKPKQRAVLELLAGGETTQGIALRLKLSPKTVEFHRRMLMEATGIFDYPSLTRLAVRLGLAELDV